MKPAMPSAQQSAAARRWKRFKRRKRALAALILLGLLYAVSLCADLIANHQPLLVRYRGRFYFPLVRYYPEDTFTGSGRMTRPDYRRIAATPEFTEHRGHFMIFAPVPYGPYESIDPASLQRDEDLTVEWHPVRRAVAVVVDADLRLQYTLSAEAFFGPDARRLSGLPLDEILTVSAALQAALDSRFRNEPAAAFYEPVTVAQDPGLRIEAGLSPFEPRTDPPAAVRILLRDLPADPPARAATFVFRPDLSLRSGAQAWETLPGEARTAILQRLQERDESPLEDETLEIAGRAYRLQFGQHAVQWPYPPTRGHRLGIDGAGRDVFARILYGLRISMNFGLLLVVLSYALGILAGALQGYYAGRLDIVAQRLTEIWSALPFLYIMILMGAVLGPSFGLLLICYGLFNWIGISYYVRAECLRLRRLPFVDAARAMGVPGRRIIWRHILPNALTPVITFFPFSLVGAIGALAALDYLGFGLPPPTPSLGQLLQQAQQYRWAWWLILYPALALLVVILLGVFIGEGIREAHDPKPYTRME